MNNRNVIKAIQNLLEFIVENKIPNQLVQIDIEDGFYNLVYNIDTCLWIITFNKANPIEFSPNNLRQIISNFKKNVLYVSLYKFDRFGGYTRNEINASLIV